MWEIFTKMTVELGLEEVVRAYQVKIIIRHFKNLKQTKANCLTILLHCSFVTFYSLKGQQQENQFWEKEDNPTILSKEVKPAEKIPYSREKATMDLSWWKKALFEV